MLCILVLLFLSLENEWGTLDDIYESLCSRPNNTSDTKNIDEEICEDAFPNNIAILGIISILLFFFIITKDEVDEEVTDE